MTAAWETPVLGHVSADDLGADGWASGAAERLELCRNLAEERAGAA